MAVTVEVLADVSAILTIWRVVVFCKVVGVRDFVSAVAMVAVMLIILMILAAVFCNGIDVVCVLVFTSAVSMVANTDYIRGCW